MSSSSDQLITIDGELLEGGGQILRVSVALSSLLNKAINIVNIRAKRDKPGLRPQHLTGIQLLSQVANAKLDGCEIGSTAVKFRPNKIKGGSFYCDAKTAGSIVLLLQVSLPVLIFAKEPSKLTLKGGTNVEMAPPIDEITSVFKPIVERMGVNFNCDVIRRGYYPKGGGEVMVTINPLNDYLKPIVLVETGHLIKISGYSYVAGTLPVKLAHQMADSAVNCLRSRYNVPITIDRVKETENSAFGNGSGIILIAQTSNGCIFGSSAIGSRNLKSNEVGIKAAEDMISELSSGGCVDRVSRVKCGSLTLHTKTAIHFCEMLTE
ncbi:RNA 3' [Dinothrombium tinctorium]|uniref:RNA 3'-terminal phosphate cyclase n=1 Tax=Dinothrombium tinctorium TaxID=1965070 RepID=A0A443R7D4_9ACAR|nr:RNA 3' [Dinothrombium tinctorium]